MNQPLRIVCAWCGRVRTSEGDWRRPEAADPLAEGRTTHGICHDCLKRAAVDAHAR